MSPNQILTLIGAYFALLLVVSWLTGRKADNKTFFLGNKKSPWFLVAFGMIGASLSGVTFISIPGMVANGKFHYMQMVLGYMPGYLTIALLLIPLYYKLGTTSIYAYLGGRFGSYSYRTGAAFFLLSRVVGASLRLLLVAGVLHVFVFRDINISFATTVAITIGLIWVYTFRGGIRTIVWTDSLQTACMLIALLLTLGFIASEMGMSTVGLFETIRQSEYATIFSWELGPKTFFPKQFLAGAFVALAMTGLDQDMMQKNLSIRNAKEAKRNIYWQMGLHLVINLLFLGLGAALYLFGTYQYEQLASAGVLETGLLGWEQMTALAQHKGIEIGARTDYVFPMLALEYLKPVVGATFIIGLIAAAYSSADSALTSLTTSFCVDFLGFKPDQERRLHRYVVHLAFSLLILGMIVLFHSMSAEAVINRVFTYAGYTYGPLIGLFGVGMFTKWQLRDHLVPWICVIAATLSLCIGEFQSGWYQIGHELLIVNALFTIIGLWLIRKRASVTM